MLKVPLENDDIYILYSTRKGERHGHFDLANGGSDGRSRRRVLVGGQDRLVAIA